MELGYVSCYNTPQFPKKIVRLSGELNAYIRIITSEFYLSI